MDYLYPQLAVEKKKRAGQRAADPGDPGQTLEPKQELQRSKRSEQKKAKRSKTDQPKAQSGKEWFFLS